MTPKLGWLPIILAVIGILTFCLALVIPRV